MACPSSSSTILSAVAEDEKGPHPRACPDRQDRPEAARPVSRRYHGLGLREGR